MEVIKFFPAEAIGGVKVLKALAGPYQSLKYVPTGGIGVKNMNQYLEFDKVLACGGSWMVDKQLIQNKDFEKITELSREAVRTMLDFKVKLVQPATEAKLKGSLLEPVLCEAEGENGRILITTSNVERAVYHLEKQNIFCDQTTAVYSGSKLQSIHLCSLMNGMQVILSR